MQARLGSNPGLRELQMYCTTCVQNEDASSFSVVLNG